MTAQHPKIFGIALGMSLLFCICALLVPNVVQTYSVPLAVLLIIGVGIPHGAADFEIFKQLNTQNWSNLRFFGLYLSLCGLYAGLWWWQAGLALLAFLLLSAYHFGQSNWQALLEGQNWMIKMFTYLIWGCLIVLAPLLFHFSETQVIIEQIIEQQLPKLSVAAQMNTLYILTTLNISWITVLLLLKKISTSKVSMEYLNLTVLLLIFYMLPLLLAFTLYFVLWHSLSSMQDQVYFFRQVNGRFGWRNYVCTALPFTLLAIVGMGGWYAIHVFTGVQNMNIGLLFSFIAIITLPHTLVMEGLYQQFNRLNIEI